MTPPRGSGGRFRGSPRSSRGIALRAWRAMTTLAFSAPFGASARRRSDAVAAPHVLDAGRLGDLLRVLRNTFISNRRTAARRPATATAPEDLERFEANTQADPVRAFEARQLYAKIAELPDHQRDVLVAVDLLGLSYKEAGDSLGVPTGTIMSR